MLYFGIYARVFNTQVFSFQEVPLYTEVFSFQGVGMEFHCIQRCPHFRMLGF